MTSKCITGSINSQLSHFRSQLRLPLKSVQHPAQFFQLRLCGPAPVGKGSNKSRQRPLKILIHKFLTADGVKLILGDPHSHHTVVHVEHAPQAKFLQHGVSGGAFPVQLLLAQLHQFFRTQGRIFPNNIRKAALYYT